MSNAIQDYVKFNVLGIEEDLVSEEDKLLLTSLNDKKLKFLNAKGIVFENYSIETQLKIINGLKQRQGPKCRITFINSRGYPVQILRASWKDNKVLLRCVFCKTRVNFNMWLSTFIKEYKEGKITKLKPDKFVSSYFITCEQKVAQIDAQINEIKEKYNKIYREKENALKAEYEIELAKTNRVKQEAKSKRYQMTPEEALEKAKSFKGLARVKNYWNTKLSEEEKQQLIEWISNNIYSIRVYGLLGGQSGSTLLNEYNNVGDIRYREIKLNDEGKVTSQDSIVAHISFKQIADAPIELFKKVVSTKGRNDNIFYGNRLNDKNLALFLLSEYHDKGFKAGVRNLYNEIKTA